MFKKILLSILVIAISFGVYIYFKNNKVKSINTQTPQSNEDLAKVSSHNNEKDCWTIIEGKIYNITSFVLMHPGKEKILTACGIDATNYFNGKLPKGRLHSDLARELLKKYLVN